jgi:hypothetical protein
MNEMRWAEHVAFLREVIVSYRILVGKPESKRRLRSVEGRIILKWILNGIECED